MATKTSLPIYADELEGHARPSEPGRGSSSRCKANGRERAAPYGSIAATRQRPSRVEGSYQGDAPRTPFGRAIPPFMTN